MARNKVRRTYILNDTARRTSCKKREGGLEKKLGEITTLCDIKACTVVYSDFDDQPLVWPSVDEARNLIMQLMSSPEDVDRVKRKVNQETFITQMIQKTEEKLRKQKRENRRMEITQIMFQAIIDSQGLSMLDMGDYEELTRVTNMNLMELERMMEIRLRQESSLNSPPPPPPHSNSPPPPPPPPQGGIGGSGVGGGGRNPFMSHEFMPPNHGTFQASRASFSIPVMPFSPRPIMTFLPLSIGFPTSNMAFHRPPSPPPQGGAGGSGGQHLVLSHHEFMPPNEYGRFQSSSPTFSIPNMPFLPPPPIMTFVPPPNTMLLPPPNMMLPPPPIMAFRPSSMGFPLANATFSPPPQGGAGGHGGQHLVLSHHEFMPPNEYGRSQSLSPTFSIPNMPFPPPPPPIMGFPSANMTIPPPPQGGAGGGSGSGGQQLVLSHHEFMPPIPYGRFQSSRPGVSMPNMTFSYPIMAFRPPSMGFSPLLTDFPPSDLAYLDPNIGMPYPSNQPMFPNYHNADMGPDDPSSH